MQSRPAGLRFILVTLILDILGLGLVIPILPRLVLQLTQNDTGAAARATGLLTAAYAAMLFVFSPIWGSLSDQVGRRKVLLLALLGSGVDYFLLAWAPTLPWFFVGRLISGISGASIGTAAAYIADVSPPEKRATNFGLIGMAFGIGFVVGPLLAMVLGAYDLRLPFLAAGVLTLGNAAYGWWVVPESLSEAHRRPFSWARANPWGTLQVFARYPEVLALALYALFANLAQRSMESVWVLYTTHRFDWNVRQTSFSLAVVGIAATIVQGGLVRRIVPALGERRAVVVGLTLSTTSFVLYGLATQGWMMYAILCLGALGAISAPAAQALMSRAMPPSEQGLLQGGLSSINSLTMTLGPVLATNVFAVGLDSRLPGAPFFLGAVFLVVGLLLALRAFRLAPVAVSPPAGAKCATHPDAAATLVCPRCGSFVCPQCRAYDGVHCERCAGRR